MDIQLIRKKELADYGKTVLERFKSDIPISPERALSQSLNPDAREEDILLITASENRKLLSFIGIYPGKVDNDPSRRIFWVSCWWKANGVSSAVSRLVLEKFIEFAGENSGVPHLPSHIIPVLSKHNIRIQGREGMLVRFRSAWHSRSLQRSIKGRFSKPVALLRRSGMLRLTDMLLNSTSSVRLLAVNQANTASFNLFSHLPGEDFFSFIHQNFAGYMTLPVKESLEWICGNPWLVRPRDANAEILRRYHFSYVAAEFEHFFVEMRDEGKRVGAGFLSNRDGAVKTLFLFVLPGYREQFFNQLCASIQSQKKYHSLLTYEPEFVAFLQSRQNSRMKVEHVKRYTGTGNPAYISLQPTDADGDSCFT